jgi:hypothetical protein
MQATRLMRRGIIQGIIKKPKYHVGRGKRLKRFGNGWTDNGQEYYQELLRIFQEVKSSDVWNTLQDHWKLYQKKHYDRDDNQVEEFREPQEECEASNKDDWQIEMPDGDEIDDIEEACIDQDSPSRNSSQVIHGIYFKIIGNCIKRNITQEMIIKLRN